MTCSEVHIAYKAPTRKVFMRGDLVCNKNMVAIVTHPTSSQGDSFQGIVLWVDEKGCDYPLGSHIVLDSKEFRLFTEKSVLTIK